MQTIPIAESVHGEPVAPELRPMLERVYAEIARKPADLPSLHEALEELLKIPRFVCRPDARELLGGGPVLLFG